MDIKSIVKEFQNCSCKMEHECRINDVCIGYGIVKDTGEILKRNGFGRKLLVVADKVTISVAEGIKEALNDFETVYQIYDSMRVPTMSEVNRLQGILKDLDGVISIGTGSLNDVARLAAFREDKKLCLFATASSMDVFASYNAPIVDNGIKITYPAKSPEVVIGDTKILANAPNGLKSAGFGDMMAKYVGYIDWEVSSLITGEHFCKNVETLSRNAVDKIFNSADKTTSTDPATASDIFEGLLVTGVAMNFVKCARPAAGTEHTMAHYIECVELKDGVMPNYHGKDVGVTTLIMLRYYNELAKMFPTGYHRENIDVEEICKAAPPLANDIRKSFVPDNITDSIDPKTIYDNWYKIVGIIKSVPSAEEVERAMIKAGCATTIAEINKSYDLVLEALKYHSYIRRRFSLLRLVNLLDFDREIDMKKIIK